MCHNVIHCGTPSITLHTRAEHWRAQHVPTDTHKHTHKHTHHLTHHTHTPRLESCITILASRKCALSLLFREGWQSPYIRNALQHTTTRYHTASHRVFCSGRAGKVCVFGTHCNTPQHATTQHQIVFFRDGWQGLCFCAAVYSERTAIHCKKMQHTPSHCVVCSGGSSKVYVFGTHCNTL